MPGLVPAIHAFASRSKKDVDGRDMPGHDEPKALNRSSLASDPIFKQPIFRCAFAIPRRERARVLQ
jgi:hypothetical protein